jgi:glycosyltransferase involved in cell wall biosynthesis
MPEHSLTGPVLDVFVSTVSVMDAHTPNAVSFLRGLSESLGERYGNYEIVVVDNGYPLDKIADIRDALKTVPCVRVLRLSRTFSTDTALFAGLDAAIGDYVVVLMPDIDPIEAVSQLVELCRDGADIVQGVSTVPIGGNLLGRIGRRAFYDYNRRYLGVDIPDRATYLTGLSRRAVNSMTNSSRSHRYLRHMIRYVGYRIEDFPYEPRGGKYTSRTLRSGSLEAVEMVSSYSTHPLRVISVIGVFAGFVNLLYAIYVIVANLVLERVTPGWTTTSLQLSLMFFIICMILAVQAEYLGRILSESRREPSYFLMEELESETLIADAERRNVSD